MSFAAVHIREFPIAAWLSTSPELRGKPLSVLAGTPPQESVIAINGLAAAAGIAHSMSKVQAEAACYAHFRNRDPREEESAYRVVLEVAERFSPRVQTIAGPENEYANNDRLAVALLIDRSGTTSLFGSAESYARQLQHELIACGFEASVACAPNAEAALMLAQSSEGVLTVGPQNLKASLAQLSTSLLPCDSKTLATLKRWGIKTLGQLAELPTNELVTRLGQSSERLQRLARGEATHLLAPNESKSELTEFLKLETPLEDLERLLFALSRMLGGILAKAEDRAYALRSLSATFALDHGQTHAVRVTPAHPTQNRDALLKLLNLELQAHPPQAEVLAVRLEAEPAQPQTAQRGLFQAQFPDPDRLDLLIARLRSIAGEHCVGSPELANSHRGDDFILAAFRPEVSDEASQHQPALRLAVRLLRPAQNVRVWATNERPHLVFWQGMRLAITETAGPWHASGSWWDRTSYDCSYWDVVTKEPPYMMRLQQERASQKWNLVGLYD